MCIRDRYSALVVAGSLSLHDAAKLVQTRGRAMQGAVPAGEGAMAAVLGLSDAVIDEVCVTHCDDDAYVGAVNYNSPAGRDRGSRGSCVRGGCLYERGGR